VERPHIIERNLFNKQEGKGAAKTEEAKKEAS
jgi:hypothetical protein